MQYTYEASNKPGGQTETGYSNNVTYMADYIAPIYPMYIRDATGNILHDETTGRPLYDYGMKGLGLPYSRSFVAGGNPTGYRLLDKRDVVIEHDSRHYCVTIPLISKKEDTYPRRWYDCGFY